MEPISSSPLSSVASAPDSEFSSPLSRLSKTPSLPNSPENTIVMSQDPANRYPSPMSTTPSSGTQTPSKSASSSRAGSRPPPSNADLPVEDRPPPAKKRRVAAPPKVRTTEYLDLSKPDPEFSADDEVLRQRLVTALKKKKKIVVIAGAGISVSANIPDFRSSTGLFAAPGSQNQKMRASGKHLFDASVYKHDASTQSFHTMVREMAEMANKAKPTPFHQMLASLAQEGRLLRLYTQNIDCIDTSMKPLATQVPLNPKGPWPKSIQMHGGLEKMVCTKCGDLSPFRGEVFDGPEAPLCAACEELESVRVEYAKKRGRGIGRLRPRFVLYNEYNPDEEAIGNVCRADLKTRPDAVLVVGTSLKVPGTRRLVKEMCQVTRGRRDGFTAWINVDSEPKGAEFKDCWDVVVRSKCDVVAREVALPPWDCTLGDDYKVTPEEHQENEKRWNTPALSPKFEVHVPVKPKAMEEIAAMPTPVSSPGRSAEPQPQLAKKTKQSKLAFGAASQASKKPTKATKPRVRKPKKAKNNKDGASNTMLDSFKSVKNVVGRPGKPAAKSLEKDVIEVLPLQPSTGDNIIIKQEVIVKGFDEIGSDQPTTPDHKRPYFKETISPKSLPKGMGRLIDV